MAEDYAHYLVVNSKQDVRIYILLWVGLTLLPHTIHTCIQTQQLDERIESVVFRVEEFKQQLSRMHSNITSTSDKMGQLHDNTEQLKALYKRIDQVEVRILIKGFIKLV